MGDLLTLDGLKRGYNVDFAIIFFIIGINTAGFASVLIKLNANTASERA